MKCSVWISKMSLMVTKKAKTGSLRERICADYQIVIVFGMDI